ncbi:hypothetical protein V492_04902 [Pseudogymnoascus sp. VKM F-4246]|nr:hypothetical protein V492_04902 [Pseudogymnoascus sp. VKM F-4246]
MADSSVSSVRSEAVQPKLVEDEIAELKRKLQDAQERLDAVTKTKAASRAVPSDPIVSNNVYHSGSSSHFLLLLADSALPLGSFAFSSGLESYLAHNRPPSFTKFMTLSLSAHASATLPFVIAGHRTPERLLDLDDALDAAIMCTVGRRASVAQGRALLSIWDRAFSSAVPPSTHAPEGTLQVLKNFSALLRTANASTDDLPPASAHLAPLFGVIARITGVGEQEMAYVYMLSHVKALLSAAPGLRLAPKAASAATTVEDILRIIGDFFQDTVLQYNVRDVPPFVFEWMKEHPGQTVLYIANGVLVFTPASLTGPLLASMGWGAGGPISGSLATWIQSKIGLVGARTAYAYLQSAGMGGYGAAAINGMTQAFGVVSGGAVSAFSYFNSTSSAT